MARIRLPKLTWPLAVLLLAAFLRLYQLARVPFGWHPDEATKALLARDVLAGEFFPAFFSAFTGREALFVYLEALLFALLGEGIFVGRLLAAFVGILTVALTYTTARVMFNRRVALLTAAFLAVSLWHLIASRNGYRAVIQPLVQLPVVLLLFYGLRQRSLGRGALGYFALAGLFLGLTQYTYTAVRIFPFFIVALVLLVWLTEPTRARRDGIPLALTVIVAILVFLPLGWHFYQNPLDFYGRAAQISIFSPEWSGGEPAARLWQSVKETARMWTVWGDINYRFNISGEPVFGLVDGALFYLGLPLSVWLGWRSRGLQRAAYWSLPLWLLVMLVPMMLSAESLPYYQRAIGTLPAVYVFPALALDVGAGWLQRRLAGRTGRLVMALLLVALFGLLTARTTRDYFQRWHATPRNDDDRRVAMVYLADYLRDKQPAGALYLSTQYMQHPTLALLAPDRYDGIHWFDARQSLPLPRPGSRATYILLAENAPQAALLSRAPGLQLVETHLDRFERPVFDVYRWAEDTWPQPADQSPAVWSWETTFEPGDPQGLRNPIQLPVNFGDVMQFRGHDRSMTAAAPGDTLELVLYWELLRRPDRQYTIFAHLLSADGQLVAGFDANDYPTSFWQPEGGEGLLSYFPLAISPDTPPGTYQLEIGVYNQPTGERLQVLEGETAVADRLLLVPIEIR